MCHAISQRNARLVEYQNCMFDNNRFNTDNTSLKGLQLIFYFFHLLPGIHGQLDLSRFNLRGRVGLFL